jgi:hypothetical protein
VKKAIAVKSRSVQRIVRPTRARGGWVTAAATAGVAVAAAGAAAGLRRLARRSGVSAADLVRSLPGDELVPEPSFVVDRAATLPAPPPAVWPWLVQLGKERGWWYLPAWAERLVWNRDKSGARTILPELQQLAVGDDVPDWGPGDPVFRVAVLEPPHALAYHSVRQRSNDWRWPVPDTPRPPDCFELSWALIVEPAPSGKSRLHVRLRAATPGERRRPLLELAGGLIDHLTIALLFRGLEERLSAR